MHTHFVRYYTITFGIVLLSLFSFATHQVSYADSALGKIRIESSFPEEQAKIIADDFEFLKNQVIFNPAGTSTQELAGMMEIPLDDLSPERLLSWLEGGVRILVPESYEMHPARSKAIFPNDLQSLNLIPKEELFGSDSMINLGTYLYMKGKPYSICYSLDFLFKAISGHDVLERHWITSPQVGIIKVYNRLFKQNSYFENIPIKEIAQRIRRLSVFVHERVHGFGNNDSLGFRHYPCPNTCKLKWAIGSIACDGSRNGPLTFQTLFIRSILESGLSVEDSQKAALVALADDLSNRVIPDPDYLDIWPQTPESATLESTQAVLKSTIGN